MIPDILADPSFAPWAGVAHNYGYRAVAAVPLLVDQAPVGTLDCYRTSVHDFGPDELALLWTLANQAGTALQSSRLINSLTEQRRLLEQSEDIHRELTEVVLRAGGVQGVAEALARLQRRPVLVADVAGVVAEEAVESGGVVPVHPAQGGQFDVRLRAASHDRSVISALSNRKQRRVGVPFFVLPRALHVERYAGAGGCPVS